MVVCGPDSSHELPTNLIPISSFICTPVHALNYYRVVP